MTESFQTAERKMHGVTLVDEKGTVQDPYTYWDPDLPSRMRAAIILQGGGTRGLFFVGHLVGLRIRGIQKSLLFAGASAGALVALGTWAGLDEDSMRAFLARKSRWRFGFSIFSIQDFCQFVLSWIFHLPVALTLRAIEWLMRPIAPSLRLGAPFVPGCDGAKFEALLNELILEGLRVRKIHEKLILDLFGVPFDRFRPTFEDIFLIVEWVRLVSNVQSRDDPDFQHVLTAYPALVSHQQELRFYLDSQGNLANNIWSLVYGQPADNGPSANLYFCPIFLATVCIDDDQPIFFNNLDSRFLNTPIASMARASAGHPLVFRPRSLTLDNIEKRYVDGGLMANFPVYWTYRELKRLLQPANVRAIPADYRPLVGIPFATLGLSVIDKTSDSSYIGSILRTLTGGARHRLELELAESAPYFKLLQQEVMNEPPALDFFRVSKKTIERTYQSGLEFAKGLKMSMTAFLDNTQRDLILEHLRAMVEVVEKRFVQSDRTYVRGHFLLASDQIGILEKKAFVCTGRARSSFQDFNRSEDEFADLTGLVRATRCCALARPDFLLEARKERSEDFLLGVNLEDVWDKPEDMNLIVVIPVFDSHSISRTHRSVQFDTPPEAADAIRLINTGVSGAIIGMAIVDGFVRDGELEGLTADLDSFAKELVACGLLPALERLALEIGAIVSRQLDEMLDAAGD